MTDFPNPLSPAERIALWADKLRDMSAAGLTYSDNIYDKDRYEAIQEMAMEMMAFATSQPLDSITALKTTVFSRMSPVVAGTAAVIDRAGRILLMRRSDNQLWCMPGGQMEVGETPAEAVVRETYEETGVRCFPTALSGIYDSRISDMGYSRQHVYKFTFLCQPVSEHADVPSHAHESIGVDWFDENNLPHDLHPGHAKRIHDAYQVRNGNVAAYFDWTDPSAA
jgi:8-oxo-dGTP pyrophosphatase MutT (NUDIX family)